MKVKYQIFVSSTYEDLKRERDLVIKAILEMGHIPVGMEMFSAGDEEQWKLIQKQIDDCDYYVVIIAHRYGSMDGTISYTEKEYDYAVSRSIPALGFIIDDNAKWPKKNVDTDTERMTGLAAFKGKVKRKIVSFWKNSEDLYGKVSIALMKQFTINPRVGWVKSNETVGSEVMNEISRLSKENSELRTKVGELLVAINREETEKYHEVVEMLRKNKIELSFFYTSGTDWENHTDLCYDKLFIVLAPELAVEKSTRASATFLGLIFNPEKEHKDKTLRMDWPIPSNTMKQLLVDWQVLDLVKPSAKKHSVKDRNEYWTLTEFGNEIYKSIRKDKLIASSASSPVKSKRTARKKAK